MINRQTESREDIKRGMHLKINKTITYDMTTVAIRMSKRERDIY